MNNKKVKKNLPVIITGAIVLGFVAWLLFNNSDTQKSQEFEKSGFDTIEFRVVSEWDEAYRLHAMYPITPNAEINTRAETEIDSYVSAYREELLSGSSSPSNVYELNIFGEVDFATDEAVHFVYEGFQIIDGVKSEIEVTRLFDLQSGQQIENEELFINDEYLTYFSNLSRQQLPEVLGVDYDPELVNAGTEPITNNFDVYELSSSSEITLVFEPGKVALKEVGVVKVTANISGFEELLTTRAKEIFALVDDAANSGDPDIRPDAPPQETTGMTDCQVVKCVALSFDDGPGAPTEELLDVLAEYNVPATFFYIGRQVPAQADTLKKAHDAGHDIGSHTWDHIDLAAASPAEITSQLDKTSDAIVAATGVKPVVIRPPYGSFSDQALQVAGLPFILWSVDPEDWKDQDADTVYNRVIENVRDGSVVLSHDIYQSSVDAYKRIIPELLNQGYTFVTATDMFNIDPNNPPSEAFYSL